MKAGFKSVIEAFDFFKLRKRAYQLSFTSPAGQEVLIDLAKFCRAGETTFHDDPRRHALLEGRREVWLRIQQHLNLTSEQLFEIYTGRTFSLPVNLDEDHEPRDHGN